MKFLKGCSGCSVKRNADTKLVTSMAMRTVFAITLAAILLAIGMLAVPATQSLAQSPASGMGDDSSTYGNAQDKAAEERQNASPEERENAEKMSPNDEGPISEGQDDGQKQMENASPEEEKNADRADPNRDEPGTQEKAQEDASKQAENATPEEEANADKVDGESEDGGFLNGIAIKMFKDLTGWMSDRVQESIEAEAERRTENLTDQIKDGRYQIEPPSNGLTEIYRDTANWVKPAAIALFLLLGLSMTLRGANYDTAYAAQTGIPKIVIVLAGIAFMPEIIGLIADLSTSISEAVIDEQAMTAGMEQLATGEATRLAIPTGGWFYQLLIWGAKLVLTLLILLAVAVTNLVFAILFVVGPLAIIFHAIPRFSDVAAAWFRGILACFAISVLWALEFGLGYRIAGSPEMLYDGVGSRILPVILNLGILWLVWKTPWWVFQWAFYSYSAGGGGGARTALSLLNFFRK